MKRSPQRVLFLPNWYPNPEDPQLGVFLRGHAEALGEKLQVSLIYPYPDTDSDKAGRISVDRSRGFTEIFVHYRATSSSIILAPLRFFRYLRAMIRGWRTLLEEEGKPDLVHAHILDRPAFFAYLLKLRYGIPFFISEQWSGFMSGKAEEHNILHRWTTAFLLRRASGVSAVSDGLAKALVKSGAPEDPWVIPNSFVDPGPPKAISKEPFRFFNISDMVDDIKNLSGLIEAFSLLKQERPEKEMELHIVGGGPDEEWIRDLVFKRGLEDSVVFYGRVPIERVHELFPQMSVLVVNSIHETFSIVTVEALAHGKPVLASRCGGPEGILKEEGLGILFPKGDTEATKAAMRRSLDEIDRFDPEELHRYAMEHYGREPVRDRYIEFYRKALAEG